MSDSSRDDGPSDALYRLLIEQGHSPLEATNLLPTLQQLPNWTAPKAAPGEIETLLSRLAPLLTGPSAEIEVEPAAALPKREFAVLWQLLKAQLPLIRREIWLASAFVLALGWIMSVIASATVPSATIFALIAPLMAALGLSVIYGPENDVGLELALTTPTSPRQVLLARFVLVFGYDLALTLALSAAFKLVVAPLDLLSILSLWIGPMFFLAGLALLLSLAFGSDRAIQFSLVLWVLRVMALTSHDEWVQNWAGLWSNTCLLAGVAAVLFLVSFIFVKQKEYTL